LSIVIVINIIVIDIIVIVKVFVNVIVIVIVIVIVNVIVNVIVIVIVIVIVTVNVNVIALSSILLHGKTVWCFCMVISIQKHHTVLPYSNIDDSSSRDNSIILDVISSRTASIDSV
jgi:hypothetical protein